MRCSGLSPSIGAPNTMFAMMASRAASRLTPISAAPAARHYVPGCCRPCPAARSGAGRDRYWSPRSVRTCGSTGSAYRKIIFDETYYVPDALGILRYGVEHNYVSDRNRCCPRQFAYLHGWRRVRGASASGKAVHRVRRVDVRAELVRLAVRHCLHRLAGHPAAGPDRPPDDQVHPARLRGWPAAGPGRAGIRDEPDRPAGHLPDVLGAGRIRLPGGGPRCDPGPVGRGGWGGWPGPAAGGARAGPLVAGGRRSLPGPRPGLQVGRDLVRDRVRHPHRGLGPRRAANRWSGRRAARHAYPGQPVAAGDVRAGADRRVRHHLAGWFISSTGYDRQYAAQTGRSSRLSPRWTRLCTTSSRSCSSISASLRTTRTSRSPGPGC